MITMNLNFMYNQLWFNSCLIDCFLNIVIYITHKIDGIDPAVVATRHLTIVHTKLGYTITPYPESYDDRWSS